ncbi:ThiF family adenylyltransferase [Candidatus Woesearchaeota archaeon]|nr:ThiF family adenylyltransferase [Candidatus Woesearchaeota archaeon]
MVQERYSRQAKLRGWDQGKIADAGIVIVGANNAGCELAIGLAEMGYTRIVMIGEEEMDGSEWFVENCNKSSKRVEHLSWLCAQMNSDVVIEPIGKKVMSDADTGSFFSDKVDLIVDMTNDLRSKTACVQYAKSKAVRVISGASTNNCLVVTNFAFEEDNLDDVLGFHAKDYARKPSGFLNASLVSSLIMEEIRKMVMPLKYDAQLRRFYYGGIRENSETIDIPVLMVGAGAIGSNVGRLCACTGVQNLAIVDFDLVELGNLGNQIWYYNSPKTYKAQTLADKMKRVNRKGRYVSHNSRFDLSWDSYLHGHKVDVLLSCVDNNPTRLIMQDLAEKHAIPLINGGSSSDGSSCIVNNYLPSDTPRIDEQDLSTKEPAPPKNEDNCFGPSLTIPNRIAAVLIVNRLKGLLSAEPHRVKIMQLYYSARGIVEGEY